MGALCIFINVLKGNIGWRVKKKGLGVAATDFPTVYMLISNLTALVLEPFLHGMLINFFSFCPGLFGRHLTADGKMLIHVCMESFLTGLFCWMVVTCHFSVKAFFLV